MSRLAMFLPLLLVTAAAAGDWPQWRGSNFDAVSPEKNLPAGWGESTDGADGEIVWRTDLPGPGGGTPVVAGGRLYVTAVDGAGDSAELKLVALDAATGEQKWERTLSRGDQTARGDEGNRAAPSCVTDGARVWATFGDGTVACLTADGGEVWALNLQDRFGRFDIQFGFSSTPVLHDGRLYFQLIHGDGDSATEEARVVALDAATGVTVWERGRVTGATIENEHSYASPVLNPFADPPTLITHGADYAIAHDLTPGADGRELWRLGGLNPRGEDYHRTLRFVASVGVGETPGGPLVVVPTAKRGPVFAVNAAAAAMRGLLTSSRPIDRGPAVQGTEAVAWKLDRGTPDVPTPLVHGTEVYLLDEKGVLACHDSATGGELYRVRTHGGRHRASPVFADGKLYLTARDGTVTVAKAGRDYEQLSQQSFGEPISASPAVAGGTLFFRTFEAVYAVRKR